MGKKFTFKCTGCDYEVVVSGGPDRGMRIATNTVVCLDCSELQDVVTEKYFEVEDPDLSCKFCGSKDLKDWNNSDPKCPKCLNNMKGAGLVFMWD